MPPKKRGAGAAIANSKSKSNTRTRKPDPSTPTPPTPPPLPSSSSASRFSSQSLTDGPTANKALEKGAPSPAAGATTAIDTQASQKKALTPTGSVSGSLSVGPQSESAGGGSELTAGKSNLKKKVVRRVVRKVKKPCLTTGAQPELGGASSNVKMDLEKEDLTCDKISIGNSEPSVPTFPVEAVVKENPVACTEVVSNTGESVMSGAELNTEKSGEATESGGANKKVKKVIRKVIKKKIVKKMVPKGTLAAKKAAEAVLGLAEEQAKSGNVVSNKAGEEMEKTVVPDVNPSDNARSTTDGIKLGAGGSNWDKVEKNTEGESNNRGNPSPELGDKKNSEESKELVIKIEGDKENNSRKNTDSENRKEINKDIKVEDKIQEEKPVCSSNNNEKKVRKVIKKKIIKKLVPKGTLAKRKAEENLNISANSEATNYNSKCEDTPGVKPETDNQCPGKKEGKLQEGSVTLDDNMLQNSSLNAGAEEMDGLTERQKRRKTEIFIGGLDKDVKEVDIRAVFGQVGEIVEVRMFVENNTGKNKGYCFLRYKEPAQAKKAISMFSKVKIRGKSCGASPVEDHDSIFLGNIDRRWKKDDIIRMLKDFGIEKIDTVTVMQDPQNPALNRGFAFLDLETNRDAQIAYKKLKAGDFSKGGRVKIDWAEPWHEPDEEEMLKVKSVFVECIPSSWDKARMSEIFEKFGKIERVVLSRDIPSSKRKDYAFVNYTTREAAISCIKLIEKEELVENGSKVNIKVSLAKPVSKGKMAKGGGRPSASEKEKPKMLQSGKTSIPDRLRVLKEPAPHHEISNPKGKSFETYRHGSLDQKRGFSSLSDGPEYSDVRGFPRPRYESSYHGFHSSSNSSYGGMQPYGAREPSLLYQNSSFGFASGSFDGKQPYYPDTSETRERAFLPHGHRSWPYPRCRITEIMTEYWWNRRRIA